MRETKELKDIIKELVGPVDTAREKELRSKFMTILTESEQPKQDRDENKD